MKTSMLSTILLIGIASNLDNGGVGIAYGVRKISIPFWANLVIALISCLCTALAGYFGRYIARFFSPIVGNILGTIVLVSVGLWVLWQPFRKKNDAENNMVTKILQNPEKADWDGSKSIGFWESVVLGVALAMNALAGGFDAGVTGLNIIFTALSVGVFSLIFLGGAAYLGKRYVAQKLGDRATIVAGILLILIGFHQML
ncbi:sporulation membrane protein YtaF [Collibacillus ludicampi]|uniref:Sporulation membrane protein YtaF n=1 Tax=Collibacillus ludicampi TaxID=2771369 RepID=A0AAV4LAD7_9BACL|nr:sporulation membrane protein YtaF [Collibacillus ludicampi]GIM44694.1 sporulation membrane protein YtaF [Collibacillus ludicampi]